VGIFYLSVAAWGYGYAGFPLDDAWIHQTYARNFAETGQLAFVPGAPSAGSTAPLWSLLLSLGYLLSLPFQIWTYSLGMIFLGLTGWTIARLGVLVFPENSWIGLGSGLFCILEWHLIWAAVSGMETILFVWLSTFLLERYLAGQSPQHQRSRSELRDFGLGFLGGLLILTRPEGLGLIGLVALDMAYRWWRYKAERPSFATYVLKRWSWITIGVGLLLAPYVGFHLWATGLPFPNTFYAKQAEYKIILESFPFWWRLFGNIGSPTETVQGVFRVIFVGAQILLLPGLIVAAWLTFKEQRFELVPIWLWWVGYLLLYGLRLPVTYQHGRYQIPAIVWVVLLGVWGTIRILESSRQNLALRVASRALVIALGILVAAFVIIGAQAYGRDVRFIESEMVATAKWLDQHLGQETLIAAHDIGAIGYFTQRPIVDLAGLVSPEVIPIIRDEPALFNLVIDRQADYLVTFPAWYPDLTKEPALNLMYSTEAPWTLQMGGDNMAVYQIDLSAKP
jgi:hypothetical protein